MREDLSAPREADILSQLDSAQKSYTLLGPGNAHYPHAALRMTAFASRSHWLLALQAIAWARRDGKYIRDLQTFGSAGEFRTYTSEEILGGTGGSLWSAQGTFSADPHSFEVMIKGQSLHFQPSDEEYAATGIDLPNTAPELALLRYVTESQADNLLLPAEEIIGRFPHRELTLLFTLNEWTHPDEAEDQLPSDVRCFQQIASILARVGRCPLSAWRQATPTGGSGSSLSESLHGLTVRREPRDDVPQ